MYSAREKGKTYEDIAVRFLQKNGYFILERNFNTRQGEVDIIALDEGELVFVEVKARRSHFAGEGADAVNKAKQIRISKAARWYLAQNYHSMDVKCRFDVVTYDCGEWRIIRNAFYYCWKK